MSGKLSIVSTPIGNLGDITLRAVEVLRSADAVAVEDTRIAARLLKHFDIQTKLIQYHDHNEQQAARHICELIRSGKAIALTTDAGTPTISDPGYRLVQLAGQLNLPIEVIPGPSAVTAALSVSGLPTDSYFFEGFLPRKKGRQTRLKLLCGLPATIVIYESPYRILKTLEDFREHGGERVVAVCRELTKIHEEVFRGTISQALEHFQSGTIKGEFVLLIAKEGYSI